MKKLSLEALQERVGEITTVELMSQISGGTDNDCHLPPRPTYTSPSKNPIHPSTVLGGEIG